jgi:hypothetical protein
MKRIVACTFLLALTLGASSAVAARLRLYPQQNYEGASRVYLDEASDTADSGQMPAFESAKVISGRWLLCSRPHFAGNCLWLWRDTPSFEALGFNSAIGSVRPEAIPVLPRHWGERQPPGRSALVFFQESDFQGDWESFYEDVPDFNSVRIRAASVVIQKQAWRLCSLPEFGGDCIIMTSSSPDIRKIFPSYIRSAQRVQ